MVIYRPGCNPWTVGEYAHRGSMKTVLRDYLNDGVDNFSPLDILQPVPPVLSTSSCSHSFVVPNGQGEIFVCNLLDIAMLRVTSTSQEFL